MKKTNIAKNIIILSIVVLILFGIVAAVWIYLKHTNGGTEDFKTFTVEIDGELIVTEKTTCYFGPGAHTVKVAYIFDGITGEEHDFTAKIKPKPGASFDYTADGKTYPWSDVQELEKAFALKKEANGFTFTVPNDHKAVLEALYAGETVTAPESSELKDRHIFELVISSYNEKIVYTIDFAVLRPVEGVDAQPGDILF